MVAHITPPEGAASWNNSILANPDSGNVFQSTEFAAQKLTTGWKARYITTEIASITVLEKHIPLLGRLWYIPKGPGVVNTIQLKNTLNELIPLARSCGAFAIKIEPELLQTPETMADIVKLGLIKVRPIQPNFSTVTIDLSPDLNTILANLNQKGRHAIRRAERDGVTVQSVDSSDSNCRTMYDLLSETAAGSFAIRPYTYYKSFWQRFDKAGIGQLFFAYVDNVVVAGAYAVCFGKKSTYKDGASVRNRLVYGASHLLQWNVIKWAYEQGATVHDLCGAPPSDQIHNPDHPHYGIGRFKTSFNKEVTDYVGAFDVPVKLAAYTLWSRFGERVALRLWRSVKHESFY